MACWIRYGREDIEDQLNLKDTVFLTQQLKFAREQIDKKSRLNDDLTGELRKLQVELEHRSSASREARELVLAGAAELRAASHAHESERCELQTQLADLEAELEAASNAEAVPLRTSPTGHLLSPCLRESSRLEEIRTLEAALEAAEFRVSAAEASASSANARSEELARELEMLEAAVFESADREAALTTERARLQAALSAEKELHQEALRLVEAQRLEGQESAADLRQELQELSAMLSQKEEDFLNIQFEMASLMNRLGDERALVNENADAFQSAAEELADKEELLEKAQKTQEDLHSQMNELSEKLQGKVSRLTEELEGSRSSYKMLEEQSKSSVARLEADREALSKELERVRAEAGAELASLRAQLQRREAAASERRTQLELELTASRVAGDRTAKELEAATAKLAWEEAAAQQAASAAREVLETELHEEARRQVSPRLLLPTLGKLNGVNRPEASAVLTTARSSADRIWLLEEKLAVCNEQLATVEAQNRDLSSALELSKLLEREANERAVSQEAVKDLRLIEAATAVPDFEAAAPRREVSDSNVTAPAQLGVAAGGDAKASCGGAALEDSAAELDGGTETSAEVTKVHHVLISIDLDLGKGKMRTLAIAPWHTRSDFDEVVQEFLEKHRLNRSFAQSLVRFLEEAESKATVFPTSLTANLLELYSRFG